MADAAVKPEIKVDPASTPQTIADLPQFEPTYDLDFPRDQETPAWLVKLPKYLWQHWADIYRNSADDVPIEIGKMRVKKQKGENADPMQQEIQIRLAPGVPQHRGLPMNYNLNLKTQGYSGTVVFSEKEETEASRKARASASKPTGIQSKSDRYGKEKREVKPGDYQTAVKKETALAPVIQHVADAQPQEDQSYSEFAKKQYLKSVKPKRQTVFTQKIDKAHHPAANSNLSTFNAFGLSSRPSTKKKAPKEKAVRMPQEELLDALDRCFRRYSYWSLKALRNELKQPEAYIKQTLEQIAVLVRSGDFAMNYKLKDEYKMQHQIKEEDVKQEHKDVGSDEEQASATGTGSGSESEVEDFEDVKMEG